MNDENLRQKYINLRARLYVITNKLNTLVNVHDKTYVNLSDFIRIDNQIIDEKFFQSIKEVEKNVLDELNDVVIPSINNKL